MIQTTFDQIRSLWELSIIKTDKEKEMIVKENQVISINLY